MPRGQLMNPLPSLPGSSTQRGHLSRVEGTSPTCGRVAWQPPIGLACVEVTVQHEVTAVRVQLAELHRLPRKSFHLSFLQWCLAAGPFRSLAPASPPTVTALCPSPGPCSVGPACRGHFLVRRVGRAPAGPVEARGVRARSFLQFPRVRGDRQPAPGLQLLALPDV